MHFAAKFAAAALAALATAGTVNAACATLYSRSTCTGNVIDKGCAKPGKCNREDGATSTRVTCANETSASGWIFEYWDGSTTCAGTANAMTTGSGSAECATLSLTSGNTTVEFGVKTDCASSCFSGTDTVELEGGAKVPLSQLRVGDRVLAADDVGNLFYDKVHRVPHWDADQPQDYLRITTESGRVLEVSRGHYLHAGACCSLDELKLAIDVRKGDDLYTVDDKTRGLMADTVVSVEPVRKQGAYNVHTLSGNIVVNGVAASHFSSETTWGEKTRAYAPIWYKALDLWHSVVGGAEDARNQ